MTRNRIGDAAVASPAARPAGGNYRWTICALLFFATTVNYLDRQVLSLLAPSLSKEFGWSNTDYANIAAAFQFEVSGIERFLVSCYDAEDGGVFHAHRDNTTLATAYRQFACSLNLNDGFEGGDLRFPEFGAATYRAPPGGAVVFSCSLLHQVSKVTAGERYAFLPFLYDDAAAKIREANIGYLGDGTAKYVAEARAG